MEISSKGFGDKMPFSISRVAEISMEADDYRMATVRSHDQVNTMIYGMDDRYRGIHGERRVVFMNPADIAAAGMQAGDKVDLFSYYEGVEKLTSFSTRRGLKSPYFEQDLHCPSYFLVG